MRAERRHPRRTTSASPSMRLVRCPRSSRCTVDQALDGAHQHPQARRASKLQTLQRPGPGLPHAGRGHPGAFGRRGPAAEAGQRDGPRPGRHPVRVRRAHHRAAPPGRGRRCSRCSQTPGRARGHRGGHRTRPGRDRATPTTSSTWGPAAARQGGRIVCAGTPEQVAACPASVTGRYLARELGESKEQLWISRSNAPTNPTTLRTATASSWIGCGRGDARRRRSITTSGRSS